MVKSGQRLVKLGQHWPTSPESRSTSPLSGHAWPTLVEIVQLLADMAEIRQAQLSHRKPAKSVRNGCRRPNCAGRCDA